MLMLNGLPSGLTRALAVLAVAMSCMTGTARSADSTATPAQTATAGYVVVIGGALTADNDAVWSRLVQLAGGPGARYVVFATASGNPERSAGRIIANLRRHGAVAEHVAVAPMLPGVDVTREVENPKWIEEGTRRASSIH